LSLVILGSRRERRHGEPCAETRSDIECAALHLVVEESSNSMFLCRCNDFMGDPRAWRNLIATDHRE
jgi:hypothetical protein